MNKRKSVIFATFLSIMQCFLFAESKADHSLHSMDNPSQPLCHWEYSFENQHDLDKWYWVSYPVLNTITDNALIANEFFDELLVTHLIPQNGIYVNTPTYLEEIRWYNEAMYNIYWDEEYWNDYVESHFVSSSQGYKIKLQSLISPDFLWPVKLKESGFRTPDVTEFTIHGGMENWLGYFCTEARMPQDAFADIWNDITMIKAKDWSLFRMPRPGNYWGMQGRVMPIRAGDMVIVTTNNSHDFQWGTSNPTLPLTKAVPEDFIYNEKQDYIPIYISLPDSLMPDLKEIGLYVDGVCKGAVVVEDNLEQISAYVDSAAELSDGNVELVFSYEEGKRSENTMKSLNMGNGRFHAKYGNAGSAYPFFDLKLSPEDMDSIVPPEFSLRQNYPNPFNPSTTISYSLPIAGKVRLDIYNVKGQLVKTLLNKDMEAGLHSIIWNGRDMNNQSVASGIYFYRLSSPSMTQTKRMLLMK